MIKEGPTDGDPIPIGAVIACRDCGRIVFKTKSPVSLNNHIEHDVLINLQSGKKVTGPHLSSDSTCYLCKGDIYSKLGLLIYDSLPKTLGSKICHLMAGGLLHA